MDPIWLTLSPFAIVFFWVVFFGSARPQKCPNCEAALPRLQSPLTKSGRQWAEGGYLCPNCGCETDRAGAKVPRGTAPHWGWFSLAVGLPAATLALAFFLITRIVSR